MIDNIVELDFRFSPEDKSKLVNTPLLIAKGNKYVCCGVICDVSENSLGDYTVTCFIFDEHVKDMKNKEIRYNASLMLPHLPNSDIKMQPFDIWLAADKVISYV